MNADKPKITWWILAAAAVLILAFGGCGQPGEDGASYMGLDWVYAPQALYFPALPAVISPGSFYQHPAGSYPGEYIAWDGSYYSFTYLIEVNRGEAGGLLGAGEDGADRYYLMYLYSWGPEFYYYDDLSLARLDTMEDSLCAEKREAEQAAAARLGVDLEERVRAGRSEPLRNRDPLSSTLDMSLYDLDHAEPYSYERSGPGYRLRIEGLRSRPAD